LPYITTWDDSQSQNRPTNSAEEAIFIPEPICRYRGLTPGAKIALGRLFRCAGKNGKAYPAMPTLGVETGVGSKQVRRYVRELEDGAFIRCEREAGKASHYVFLWHAAYQGETGAARKGGRPLPKTGLPEKESDTAPPVNGSTTPPVNGRQRESDSLRESDKEIHSEAKKADIQPTNCKKRNSPAVSVSSAAQPAFRGDWTEEELEAIQNFIEDHDPDDTDDHGRGEWAAEATLNAGLGADAAVVLEFLENMAASGWTAPNCKAFPAVVHHEFERRRNRATGARWSDSDLARLRVGLTKFMEGDAPPTRFEHSCELRANGASAREVFDLLERKWADPKYRPGGKHGPRKWAWFLASSAEFVGRFWLWESSQVVI